MDESRDSPSSPESQEPAVHGVGCSACGATVVPDQRFCRECGAPVIRPCAACGAENPAGSRFCGQCGTLLEGAAQPAALAEQEPLVATPREERRWVTVLFADLSGFTAMAEQMDHEDVKALADRCMARLGEEVTRLGGTVLHVPGDEVVAVFGAPQSHEDDAERAVRASLAMRDCNLATDQEHPIQVHVAVNTGEVTAGLLGPPEQRRYTVMGDVVNTGARLKSAAPAGSVLVGEETYRATRRVVAYRELPPVAARGKERPVPAWEALEMAPAPVARPLGAASLVGRDGELAVLSEIWHKVVREARPHLVTLLGEPGIGKSRFAAEFTQRVLGDAVVLHGRCLPYGEVLGYWALATMVKSAAGITVEDAAGAARAKLGELLQRVAGGEEAENDPAALARHLALLTGLDVETDRLAIAPDQRMLHASVRRFLEALAHERPVCVMFEDIHWADSALLDLIEFVASRAQDAPLLIVTQARPELLEKRPGWGQGVRAFTSLPLGPLDAQSGRNLVVALCRQHQLPEGVVGQIGRGSGGNPLFAEELVAMIAERGHGETMEMGIPSVIKAIISARLDALPPEERETLQLAAVFGKSVWEGGLQALGVRGSVSDHLEALEQKDLLRAQPRSQFRVDAEYAFKHDLIRDVAYETLSRAERRLLHGRVADWMEAAAGERVEAYFALLAHHAVQADQWQRALGYLARAAERARRAAAHREEAALLAQAIAIAERRGEHDLVADLHAQRGTAFLRVALYDEARSALEAALARMRPERLEPRAQILADLSMTCFHGFDVASMRGYASDALALAEEIGREDLAADATGWLGDAMMTDGNLSAAQELHQRALARAGGVPVVSLVIGLPLPAYWLGRIEEALDQGQAAVQMARQMNHPSGQTFALTNLGLVLSASGRYDEAIQVFEEARRLGRDYEVRAFLARSIATSAGFHLDLFDFAGNETLAQEARELAASENWPPPRVSAGIDLVVNFARRQEVGRAETLLGEVADEAARLGGWHGWMWQLRLADARAEVALVREDWDTALHWANETIAQSRARGRVKYEVRGLGSRAQALLGRGRKREALTDHRTAVKLARPMGDPALFLRAAAALLAVGGDDTLAAEACAAAQRIAAALPDGEMRRRFEEAEPVRFVRSGRR